MLCRPLHKVVAGIGYNALMKNLCEREEEPGRKVVTFSSQPGCRNSGKNGGKILFEKRKMKAKPHEKMTGKIILSRIRVNANEIAWKS